MNRPIHCRSGRAIGTCPLDAVSPYSEDLACREHAGVDRHDRPAGFAPAFVDHASGLVYPSRFADGRPAPVHLLEGLPDELLARYGSSDVTSCTAGGLEAGFVMQGRFYTRREAALAMQ